MREIVLDTETTGLDPKIDRLVEIGLVELVDRRQTGRVFHSYYNPQRPVHVDAYAVHGLSDEFLASQPIFDGGPVLDFIQDSPLVAHNAEFDIAFLRAELGDLPNPVVDTLSLARRKFAGGNNTLDGLCDRFDIDTSKRTKHGALLDAELLAACYIELIEDRQRSLVLETAAIQVVTGSAQQRPVPLVRPAVDLEAHDAFVATIKNAIWSEYRSSQATP